MKKLFTIDDVMLAFVTAVAYGFAWFIPKTLGLSDLVAMVICMVVGGVVDGALNKVVYSEAVQRNANLRTWIYVSCIFVFLVGHYVSVSVMGISMVDGLVDQLSWVICFPIAAYVVTMLIRGYRILKIRGHYGDGDKGFTFDVSPDALDELNQQNQPIYGEYDKRLAVKTRTGTYVGEKYKKTIGFLGIPYAKPPVAELRWKAPVELEPSEDVFEAVNLGASAIQVEHDGSVLRHHRQSEDCLTLNVCIGNQRTEEKRPVLVLFHHGDFTYGGSADPLLHGYNFVNKHQDVVFVSFNYRLGIFGFIDFSEVPGGEAYPDTLNLGMLDQVAALRWVKDNIAAFGGDPDQITVVGFESGATCISLLAATGEAQGLFQRAFVFFGGPRSVYETPDASRALARRLLEETKTSTMQELAQLDTSTLKDAAQRLWLNMCAPTCDGSWIPKNVYEAYRTGAAAGVDFIFGIPNKERRTLKSLVGDQNFEVMMRTEYAQILDDVDERTARAIEDYVERQAPVLGEIEALADVAEQVYDLCIYRCAAKLSEAGNEVHLLYWDEEPLIENLGSGTVDAVTTLLDNGSASVMYGNMVDADLSVVLRELLVKFMRGADLRLYPNEVKGVEAIKWERFPEALIVSDGDMRCDTLENRLSQVDGLMDCAVS